MDRRTTPVTWHATDDARYPYAASVGGAAWQLRVNEFPEEEFLYSLIVDGEVAQDFTDWPAAWTRPDAPAAAEDAHERATYEREQAHVERTLKVSPSKLVK